ncbi:transposase [Streptomyces sp. BBFR51]|uniref:transposase n=1 Tax=Streptomyces sp. BBFR51 TaxID=3372856 RepID=UPI0037DDBEE1
MAKRKNFPEEFKRDAVDLVRSLRDRTLTDIARSLGIHPETLRNWVREDKARTQDADGGGDAGMTPDEKEEPKLGPVRVLHLAQEQGGAGGEGRR